MSACPNPIPWATLVDYWAGDLPPAKTNGVDEHLFACASCTSEAARVASVTETIRDMLPPAVSRARLEGLRAAGTRVRENVFAPGERRQVVFEADVDLMIHRLAGLSLAGAERVSLQIVSESTGERMAATDRVPFERDEGAVLIACQRHFASLPADTRFEVAVHAPDRSVTAVAYTILHEYPG